MHRRIIISKSFSFEAAHSLIHYEGECKNLHGHSYKLEVCVSGVPNSHGIVIDFKELKKIVDKKIVKRLDHAYLNSIFEFEDTTAENIICWIWNEIEIEINRQYKSEICLERIRLYETVGSYVEVQKEN